MKASEVKIDTKTSKKMPDSTDRQQTKPNSQIDQGVKGSYMDTVEDLAMKSEDENCSDRADSDG